MAKKSSTSQSNQQSPQQELESILKASGHNLHLKTSKILEGENWFVDLSAYYYDDTTEKPREIDIIAKKRVPVYDIAGQEITHFLVWLFIECKYFSKDVAFRMQPTNHQIEAIKVNTAPNQAIYRLHHYGRLSKVGKLYDTHKDNDNNVFNSITQPVKSLTFYKGQVGGDWGLFFPLTVFDGIDGIYELDGDSINLLGLTKKQISVFEIVYAYKDISDVSRTVKIEHFFIEFVHLSSVKNYLRGLEQSVAAMKDYIKLDFRKRGVQV